MSGSRTRAVIHTRADSSVDAHMSHHAADDEPFGADRFEITVELRFKEAVGEALYYDLVAGFGAGLSMAACTVRVAAGAAAGIDGQN